MATIDDQINYFLRDASYRVAELTIEINGKKNAAKKYKKEAELRAELTTFMDLLYDSVNTIKDDYTLLKQDWPEREIIAEMEYLRDRSSMADIPYLTFTGYAPSITVTNVAGGDTNTLPAGGLQEMITYDVSGNPVSVVFPDAGGMETSETIDEYFG